MWIVTETREIPWPSGPFLRQWCIFYRWWTRIWYPMTNSRFKSRQDVNSDWNERDSLAIWTISSAVVYLYWWCTRIQEEPQISRTLSCFCSHIMWPHPSSPQFWSTNVRQWSQIFVGYWCSHSLFLVVAHLPLHRCSTDSSPDGFSWPIRWGA